MDNRPIGIFDSGIGGLTVFKAIKKLLPNETLIYIGDTKRAPYGTKSPKQIKKFALQITRILLSKNVKVIVVACNTISAVALNEIKKNSPIPVVDVILPTLQSIREKNIALLATKATVKSKAYGNIKSEAASDLVPLIENGNWKEIPEILNKHLEKIGKVDLLILGCTHFPIIKSFFPKNQKLLDSAVPTAKALKKLLEKNNLLSQKNLGDSIIFTSKTALPIFPTGFCELSEPDRHLLFL